MAGLVVENAITGEIVFDTAEQAPLETQTVESLKLRLAEFCGGSPYSLKLFTTGEEPHILEDETDLASIAPPCTLSMVRVGYDEDVQCTNSLFAAAAEGNVKALKEALRKPTDPNRARAHGGANPLG